MMSWIEKQAFSVLLRQETASIKDMRPIDVPANQFSYHLNNLIQQKYIQKIGRGTYALTPAGLQLAGTISTITGDKRENMKTVIVLYGKADDGRVGLFLWSRQPYIGAVTLPHDRMSYEDTLDEALARASKDKLGGAVSLTYKVSVIMTIMHQGQIVSRMHGLVYEFNPTAVSYPYIANNGSLFLQKPDDCPELMDGSVEFIRRLDELDDHAPFEATFHY